MNLASDRLKITYTNTNALDKILKIGGYSFE
jgi:hypothetical protein